MQNPTVADDGDKIEHELVPGFTMAIQATEPCEEDDLTEPHLAYKITDPDGTEDWLCAYDVRKVG